MADLKKAACDAIDAVKSELHGVSREIWEHPEENFEEVHAHAVLTEFLEKHGFPVEKHFVDKTGFRCVIGEEGEGPNIAILCEYDALPEIGHACGHNLIAEVGVAAGIGVRAAFQANKKPLGKLTILGTPAEEGGGGKINMINAGVFKGVDAAMMAHPAPFSTHFFPALAIDRVTVKYHGKAAHASVMPWEGLNALDAAVLCYQNVSCMRQQFKPTWRVHGIIAKGGVKPNIIPELSELEYYARTPKRSQLILLKDKLNTCFESAAKATGCRAEICWENRPYLDIIDNSTMGNLYMKNATVVEGAYLDPCPLEDIPLGSTDMGNVSYEVPSIHPMFGIGTKAINHSRDFTAVTGSDEAQKYTIAVGKAMAMTALDIYTQPDVMTKIREEFEKAPK